MNEIQARKNCKDPDCEKIERERELRNLEGIALTSPCRKVADDNLIW